MGMGMSMNVCGEIKMFQVVGQNEFKIVFHFIANTPVILTISTATFTWLSVRRLDANGFVQIFIRWLLLHVLRIPRKQNTNPIRSMETMFFSRSISEFMVIFFTYLKSLRSMFWIFHVCSVFFSLSLISLSFEIGICYSFLFDFWHLIVFITFVLFSNVLFFVCVLIFLLFVVKVCNDEKKSNVQNQLKLSVTDHFHFITTTSKS